MLFVVVLFLMAADAVIDSAWKESDKSTRPHGAALEEALKSAVENHGNYFWKKRKVTININIEINFPIYSLEQGHGWFIFLMAKMPPLLLL